MTCAASARLLVAHFNQRLATRRSLRALSFDGQRARRLAGSRAHSERTAMACVDPYGGVEAPSLSAKYFDRASPSNRLAAPAPVTWLSPRPAPRAELARSLETVAALGLRGSAVAVFTALLSWADANGTAWPCVASIARRAGKSERTVYDALDVLENAGVIERHRPSLGARRRSRQSNTYRVTIPAHALPPAESPCPPRRVAPARPRRARPAPLSSCSTVAPVVVAPSPSPSPSPVVVVAPVPAAAGPSSALVQLQILQTKGPGEPDRTDARADAQARATTAPPVEPSGSPAVAQSVPEATPTKKLTRAERAAANRAAWSKRTRPSATAARAPAPRRAPSYRAPVERVPDTGPALAALREWRSTLPALGRETDRESATPAPVPGVRRPDLAQRAPVALQGLLEAFARVHVEQQAGPHARPTSARTEADSQTRSDSRGATAPSSPRVEARPAPLWSPHPRRW